MALTVGETINNKTTQWISLVVTNRGHNDKTRRPGKINENQNIRRIRILFKISQMVLITLEDTIELAEESQRRRSQ